MKTDQIFCVCECVKFRYGKDVNLNQRQYGCQEMYLFWYETKILCVFTVINIKKSRRHFVYTRKELSKFSHDFYKVKILIILKKLMK